MGNISKQRILKRRIANGQKTLKELFNILSHQGNVRFHLTPVSMAKIKTTNYSLNWEECGVRAHFFIAGGSVNLYNCFENHYGGFSENWDSLYLKTH